MSQIVSVHGGHSGQFCSHATDSLEEVILRYIALGAPWVGITEHTPSISEELLYPDQRRLGLTPEFLYDRFVLYMEEAKRLKAKYADQIEVIVAMEMETYSGYESFMPKLIEKFQPEYIVGSVHFVDDLGIDYSKEQYLETAAKIGSVDKMYCHYFDIQYEMLERMKPAVVGHFDLVRLFDDDYQSRLQKPEIAKRVVRNLESIQKHGLVMDLNLRALKKGASEPYISSSILAMAKELGIAVVPGDDSHGVTEVANFFAEGIKVLTAHGFSTNWTKPRLYSY